MGNCFTRDFTSVISYEDRVFGTNCKVVRDATLMFENGRQVHSRGCWVSESHFAAPWGSQDTWVAYFGDDCVRTTTIPYVYEPGDACFDAAVLDSSPGFVEPYRDQLEILTRVSCPSVHIWWDCPSGAASGLAVDMEISETADSTFFMAVGFHCGYMGIQERDPKWAIFSVWDGDCAAECVGTPGENVTVQRFGGEGEGLQAYCRYPWRAGKTYRCAVTAAPVTTSDGVCATDFTGWIQEVRRKGRTSMWIRIATLRRRHHTETGQLRGMYSFLEDWAGSGVRRSGSWGPAFTLQYGQWNQVLKARGTCTDPMAKNVRVRSLLAGDTIGGRLEVRSGGREELRDATLKGPFDLSFAEEPECLRALIPEAEQDPFSPARRNRSKTIPTVTPISSLADEHGRLAVPAPRLLPKSTSDPRIPSKSPTQSGTATPTTPDDTSPRSQRKLVPSHEELAAAIQVPALKLLGDPGALPAGKMAKLGHLEQSLPEEQEPLPEPPGGSEPATAEGSPVGSPKRKGSGECWQT